MTHFKQFCKHERVFAQCRCSSPSKTQIFVECDCPDETPKEKEGETQ